MRPEKLIGIGEFARRARLTVKQLRNYDELGLLPPAYVDPDSGYRYYHPRQARTAITIALLRSLDLPLAAVHAILVADPAEAGEIIEAQRAAIAARVQQDLLTLRSLDRLLGEDDLLPYEVGVRKWPSIELGGLRRSCGVADLDGAVVRTIDELLECLPDEIRAQPVTGLYPLDLQGEIEFFVGVETGGAAYAAPLERVVLPATDAVATTHIGPPAEIRLAYFPLLAHVEERSLEPVAPVRETYLKAAPDVPAEQAVTEVVLPFVKPRPNRTRSEP